MRIRWTPAAADDLEHIYKYLSLHEPHLAQATVIALHEEIYSLRRFPHLGRPGVISGTRELLHERLPYIVVYRVKDDTVEVLHIWHPSQERQ
jgi:toxin ParE1/3/4